MTTRIETRMGAFLAERLGATCIHERNRNEFSDHAAALAAVCRARDAGRPIFFIIKTPERSVWELPFVPMPDEATA